MATTKQINNLRIRFSKLYEKWNVISPDGRVLEDFDTLTKAETFAKETKDFVQKKEQRVYA